MKKKNNVAKLDGFFCAFISKYSLSHIPKNLLEIEVSTVFIIRNVFMNIYGIGGFQMILASSQDLTKIKLKLLRIMKLILIDLLALYKRLRVLNN